MNACNFTSPCFPFLLPLFHLLLLPEHGLVHFDLLKVAAVSAPPAHGGSRAVLNNGRELSLMDALVLELRLVDVHGQYLRQLVLEF